MPRTVKSGKLIGEGVAGCSRAQTHVNSESEGEAVTEWTGDGDGGQFRSTKVQHEALDKKRPFFFFLRPSVTGIRSLLLLLLARTRPSQHESEASD